MLPIESVAIWEARHAGRVLNTVEGAARCLTEGWPGRSAARSYKTACKACLAALEGISTAADARAAIVKAAEDAGILADARSRSPSGR